MFNFPKDLYTDVRIEDVYETKIIYHLGEVRESKIRSYKAAFIRIFDGERWYYSSITNIENIQEEIHTLASYAKPNKDIYDNPIVKNLHVYREENILFQQNSVSKIHVDKKHQLLQRFFPLLDNNELIRSWKANYVDRKVIKEFYSSKGAEIIFDTQLAGLSIGMEFAEGEKRLSESYEQAFDTFDKLWSDLEEFESYIKECENFLINSKPIEPGKYTVILSPLAAGVFAHESFGHKSEADFMIGDETIKNEWSIGKRVGSKILSIIDDGNIMGSGYTPFDDEGSKSEKVYLVKEGLLSGRLHSSTTATLLGEGLTGNARSINFEFEPIVRMRTTYIDRGDKTKDELFSEVEEGIYIKTIKHGSGMSTFTIAPSLAYYIRDGKIAEPVNISVITGNVMKTLDEIDGLSDEVKLHSFVLGGCGKMEQHPLPVGFGGPYVRVNNMNVQ